MKGWRNGTCRWPKDGVKYWKVYAEIGDTIFAVECECGTASGRDCYMDWKHGNFFETKEKAEAAIMEWITEEARRYGVLKGVHNEGEAGKGD
jgi:hypothetical protein